MRNIGLKDIRPKALIVSSILRMNSSGDSDTSMSFGEIYTQMVSDGTSDTSLTITLLENIALTSVGTSTITMRFLEDPDAEPFREIFEFPSKIFLEVRGNSHILKVHEGNSLITKEITIKSPIDD